MASPGLPTNIVAGGTTTGHKTHSDTSNAIVNKFDTAIGTASTGNVLAWNGSVYAPAAASTGSSAALVVAANDASTHSRNAADYLCDGTNDQTEINTAIAALPNDGGVVVLSEGTFNIASSILIEDDNVTLVGAGAGQRSGATQSGFGSRLVATSAITNSIVKVQRAADDRPVYGVLLRDFTVDGNVQGSNVDGILYRSNRGHIDHVHVHKCTGNGIRVHGYASWDTYDTTITHVQVGDCTTSGKGGIYLDANATDIHINHCILYNSHRNLLIPGGSSSQITSCHLYDAVTDNIKFDGAGSRTKISLCKIEGAGQHGINIDSTNGGYSDIQISCNGFNTNGDSAVNTYDHIIIQGPSGNGVGRTEIVGNAFGNKNSVSPTNKCRYGVNISSTAGQATSIIGNTFAPNPFSLTGSTAQILTAAINDAGSSSFPSYIRANAGISDHYAQATWDPASVANITAVSTTITLTGIQLGDPVEATFSNAVPAGVILEANVTAANTVTVTLANLSGSAVDLASGTLRVQRLL